MDRDDKIYREAYKDIIKDILNGSEGTNQQEDIFPCAQSFAISGSWGSGKTFLVTKAINDLREDSDDIIVVFLKPGEYKSFHDMLIDFNKILSKELYIYGYTSLASIFRKKFNQWVKIFFGDNSILGRYMGMFSNTNGSKQQKILINQAFKRYLGKRKIFIILDDVDRFVTNIDGDNNQSFVYKFINEYGDFSNFVLLSLLNVANYSYTDNKQYNNKFFDNILDIPKATINDKYNFFNGCIVKYLKRINNKPIEIRMNEFKDRYIDTERSFLDLFDDFRSIENFLTALTTEISLFSKLGILGKFGYYDLVVVNYIKIYDYKLYNILRNSKIYKYSIINKKGENEKKIKNEKAVKHFVGENPSRNFLKPFFGDLFDTGKSVFENFGAIEKFLRNGDSPKLFILKPQLVPDTELWFSYIQRNESSDVMRGLSFSLEGFKKSITGKNRSKDIYLNHIRAIVNQKDHIRKQNEVSAFVSFLLEEEIYSVIKTSEDISHLGGSIYGIKEHRAFLFQLLSEYMLIDSVSSQKYYYLIFLLNGFYNEFRGNNSRPDYNTEEENQLAQKIEVLFQKFFEKNAKILCNMVIEKFNDDRGRRAIMVYKSLGFMVRKIIVDTKKISDIYIELINKLNSINDVKKAYLPLYFLEEVVFSQISRKIFDRLKNSSNLEEFLKKYKGDAMQLTIRDGPSGTSYNIDGIIDQLSK